MKAPFVLAVLAGLAAGVLSPAQNTTGATAAAPAPAQPAASGNAPTGNAPAADGQTGSGQAGNAQAGNGMRGGGRGFGGGGGMGIGRGLMGTVTEVTPEHFTMKTDAGETYTVHYSANTHLLKMQARARGQGNAAGGGRGPGEENSNPPLPIKATDIKVGDAIGAMGQIEATTKSIGAVMVMQIDPERAKQMREMQANFGKTWLMGKVTAIDGVKVTLFGNADNAAHPFVADENTTFRKRRDPITLADIQVGDIIRVEGALKDGAFLAATVNDMGTPPEGSPNTPRTPPSPAPQ